MRHNEWKQVKLGDIAVITMGNSPPGESYNTSGHGTPLINGPVEFSEGPLGSTIKSKWTTAPTKHCRQGDLLVCVRGSTTGRTNVATFDACIGRGVAAIRALEYQPYLNRFFCTLRQRIFTSGKGSTFPSISQEQLAGLQIPLPPLPEQKRIAAILDAADALRAKRRESIEQLDSLIQAMFLELFGDPVTNPKGWRQAALQDTGTHSKVGPFGSLLHKADYITGGVPLVNPKHIRHGKIEHGGDETVSESKAEELSEYRLKCGDVLMGRRGEMGRCTVIQPSQEQWLCGTGSVLLRPDKRTMTSLYLCSLLSSQPMRKQLEHLSGGAIMPSLSGTQVQSLVISLPPINLQSRFASIVESIEQQKARLKAHLAELDTLFASLQSRAFNGELVA
jgi:type I restriction enzyme S subunit